jgi:hypothetical protein
MGMKKVFLALLLFSVMNMVIAQMKLNFQSFIEFSIRNGPSMDKPVIYALVLLALLVILSLSCDVALNPYNLPGDYR